MPLLPQKRPRRRDDQIELWKGWVETIQQQGVNLTVWEEDFVESVGDQLALGRGLSEKQAEILERIYAERTP